MGTNKQAEDGVRHRQGVRAHGYEDTGCSNRRKLGRLNSGRNSQQRAVGAASVAVQAMKALQIARLWPLLQCRFCGSISTPRGGTGHPLRLGVGTTGTVTILLDCSAHASEKLLGFQAQTLPRHMWSTAASGVEMQRSQKMIRSCPASLGDLRCAPQCGNAGCG